MHEDGDSDDDSDDDDEMQHVRMGGWSYLDEKPGTRDVSVEDGEVKGSASSFILEAHQLGHCL